MRMSSPRVARHDAFELPAGGVSFADGSDFLILAAKHMTISAHASGTTAWFAPPTGGLRLRRHLQVSRAMLRSWNIWRNTSCRSS